MTVTHAEFLTEMAALEHQVDMLEAERLVVLAEAGAGLSVPDARRALFPHEVRSGIRFGDIAETLAHAEKLVTEAITLAKEDMLAVIGARLPSGSREAILAVLSEIELSPPEELRGVVERLTAELDGIFSEVHSQGRASMLLEADFQGIDVFARPESEPGRSGARRAAALAVAAGLFRQVMQKAVDAANDLRPSTLLPAVIEAVRGSPLKSVIDAARQETHVEHGGGRWDALDGLPEPEYVYAGELLDSDTCDRCAVIDGYRFADLEEAGRYYPRGGPMRGCFGGNRCRGTLVVEFLPDQPGDGVPPVHTPELPRLS